jgi:hypothetical protein
VPLQQVLLLEKITFCRSIADRDRFAWRAPGRGHQDCRALGLGIINRTRRRIIWAIMTTGERYREPVGHAA